MKLNLKELTEKLFVTGKKKVVFYGLLIAAAGIALMFLSREGDILSGAKKPHPAASDSFEAAQARTAGTGDKESREAELERRLTEILSMVKGAGDVKVMVTLTESPEGNVLAVNESTKANSVDEADAEGGARSTQSLEKQTTYVILDGAGGAKTPLIIKPQGYVIEGVAIVAEGGDNIAVKDALTRAAFTVLGVPPHKVLVVKMKK